MKGIRGFVMACMAVAMLASVTSTADAGCLTPSCCAPQPVCCPPPPPVKITWCVTDPCNPCCTYEVSACLPACCVDAAPTYCGWRKGFLGRKVLTYKFLECNECVEVVITPFGRTIVR
ncbi:MAG: hypothetical protein AAGG48_18430 [Planctomycetota bacterium]